MTDGSPGAAKRINAKPYEPVDYSKNPYGNSNNEYLSKVISGDPEETVVRGKGGPTKPSSKKSGNTGGSDGGGGGGNCPCADEKKKKTQTGADIGAKANATATTGAGGGSSTSTGGGSGSANGSGGGSATTSGSGECDCEHEHSVVNPKNKVRENVLRSKPDEDSKNESQTNPVYCKRKGTAVYLTSGVFAGFIESDYPFEIHFIDDKEFYKLSFLEIYLSPEIIIDNLNKADYYKRHNFTSDLRKKSKTYINANSIKDLIPLIEKSKNTGEFGMEFGFYTVILPSRQMIFKEFKMIPQADNGTYNTFPLGAYLDYYGGGYFGTGHTHAAYYYNHPDRVTGSAPYKNASKENMFNSYKMPSNKYYASMQNGDIEFSHQKASIFNFIAFPPGGLTIYFHNIYNYQSYCFEAF